MECTPLNLEGGTPCISPWGCGAFDYQRLRRKLQVERNTLVSYLNAHHQLVLAGRAKENTAVRLAYVLADEKSYEMLERWPPEIVLQESWWNIIFAGQIMPVMDQRLAFEIACRELATMAALCHSAWCDVGNAIEAAGDTLPSIPIPPPPPESWGDSFLDFSLKVVKSVGYLALAVGIVFGGTFVVKQLRERSG